MQYDKDIRGEFAILFKKLRDIMRSYPKITEIKNEKQTSYHDEYGVVLMMRQKGHTFVLAFGKGAKLQEKYTLLQGEGKIVRHWYLNQSQDLDEVLFREMIEESFIVLNTLVKTMHFSARL